jgi:hypothetical protein
METTVDQALSLKKKISNSEYYSKEAKKRENARNLNKMVAEQKREAKSTKSDTRSEKGDSSSKTKNWKDMKRTLLNFKKNKRAAVQKKGALSIVKLDTNF